MGDTLGALGARGRRDGAERQVGSGTGPGTERAAATRATGAFGEGLEQEGSGQRGVGDGTQSDGLARPLGVEILIEPPRSKSQRSEEDASLAANLAVQSQSLAPAVEVQVNLDTVTCCSSLCAQAAKDQKSGRIRGSSEAGRLNSDLDVYFLPARLGCGGGC